jgi:lysozyme
MEVPKAALELIKRFEGFEKRTIINGTLMAVPYVCPAGYWTIGYGHLCERSHEPITEAAAEDYLKTDALSALLSTVRLCPILLNESEGRLSAIVSFTFNLGAGRLQASTLRRRINAADWEAAKRELLKWVYGGGRILPGLVARRRAEAALL